MRKTKGPREGSRGAKREKQMGRERKAKGQVRKTKGPREGSKGKGTKRGK